MDTFKTNIDVAESTTNAVVASWLRESARSFLKSAIDLEAENWNDVNLQTWKIATYNIAKKIRETSQMGFLINHIHRRLNLYAGNTCINIENRSEPVPVYSVKRNLPDPTSLKRWNTSEVNVRPKHHHQLAQDISPHQPLKIRNQALQMLLNSQLSDITSCDCWRLVQKHLVECLCDSDNETFHLSMRIHIKLLNLSFSIMKEGFMGLMDGLRSNYSRKYHKCLPKIEEGLEFGNMVHHRIIKLSHIILKTANRIAGNWVRMGEKHVEEIISLFLGIISMNTYESANTKSILYPFHVFATIDPKAKWCRRWLLCGFGRKMVLSQQTQLIPLLRHVVEEVVEYLVIDNAGKPDKPVNSISKECVRLSVFSQCVNILCCFATYKKGHTFFPLTCKVKEDPISLPEVLCLLINYLNNSRELNYINCKIICFAMATLIQTKECPFLSLTDVFMISLEPMKNVPEKNCLSTYQVPWHTINIIEALSKSETGIIFLVEGKSNVEYDKKSPWGMANDNDFAANCYPLYIIMNYTDLLLKEREKGHYERALVPLLCICAMFFKYYDLCSVLTHIPLVDTVVVHFKILHSQKKEKHTSIIENTNLISEELHKSLVTFLANVVSYPGGLLTIKQHDQVLLDLIPYLFENSLDSWVSPQFRRLILLLTVIHESEDTLKVASSKPLSKVLHNLWNMLEDEDSFVRGIERNINNAIREYMNIVHLFTCTLSGTNIFLFEYEGSEETLVETGCSPNSAAELITFEHSNDPWHKVALLTIQALTRNLNSWLFVQTKFDVEKRLLQVQMQNVSSPVFDRTSEENCNKNVIIDECSLLCHEILTTSRIVTMSKEDSTHYGNTAVLENFFKACRTERKRNVAKSDFENHDGSNDFEFLLGNSYSQNHTNLIANARKVFSSLKTHVKPSTIIALVKQVSHTADVKPASIWVCETPSVTCSLSAEEILGVKISVNHGIQIGVLDKDVPNEHLLGELLQQSHRILGMERNTEDFKGFDWFLSSVFFFCCGNIEECLRFLNNFVTLQVSLILWPYLAENRGLHDFCLVFSSLVDTVILADVPLATSALSMTGVPWGALCYSWLQQCFWTILEWYQVCEWFTLCLLHPPDVTVYFCAALLHYLQPRILRAAVEEYTWDEFVPENFSGFSVPEQIPFIEKLIKEHRHTILPKLLQALDIHDQKSKN